MQKKGLYPYDAVCTAGDDDVLGVPLVPLREQDTLDIRLRPAGGVDARQQVALHVPQVDDGSRARRNLTLEGGKKILFSRPSRYSNRCVNGFVYPSTV